MNVIAINGSPREEGNTAIALEWMAEELRQEGIGVEVVQIGNRNIRGCMGCDVCFSSGDNFCVLKDDGVNGLVRQMRQADGFIIGSPTYFGGMAGTLKCFLDRAFYNACRIGAYRNKVGAAVTSIRRAGGVATYNQIITYYHLAEMIVPPSQAWVMGYGRSRGEIRGDEEGSQIIRRHANAMAWVLKMKEATKDSVALPRAESARSMNFIR